TGTGLDTTINANPAAASADPGRIRPDDALSELYTPDDEQVYDELGPTLLDRGVITSEQLASAIRVLKQSPGRKLTHVLVELGIDEAAIQPIVAEIARLPFHRIDPDDETTYDIKHFNRLGLEFCKTRQLVPLGMSGSRLILGTCNPDDVFLLDEVKRKLGLKSVKHALVTAGDIAALADALTEADAEEYDVEDILSDVDEDDVEVVQDKSQDDNVEEEAESSPVVRYVNHIIQTAVKEGASDIHIEPDEKTMKVRFRIDGVLFEMMNPPKKMHAALTSRIKIMANLDIAERRLPQDGRIRATVLGRKLDLRVSTLPTPKGEKTVMRILDTRSINVSLDELGFQDETLQIWKSHITHPHGILLVTGPTGSGKTTTLYSSIRQMDLRKLNVSTVEDPVEYNLAGITQIQTHEKIGMSFAKALKALLRQDPDVIMLGEIRDMETATIAIQAALTGHLVLSTLHTNDAPSSITRLINIGIEPFLIGAAMNGVLAQRLVRRICANCREMRPAGDEIADFLIMHGVNTTEVAFGRGCNKCRETGYSGRVGLYELLILDDFLRDAVARNPNVTEFRRVCCERGMVSLREDGFRKVASNLTTVEEVLRVTEATI
ncbi:MAG: Flp pilus assembly complex ATPase component TadA, partial [Phycisphaerales bacterium]|nr:Flp pilus assembly complex ATPase component TadA [Phycisphaerales bacterium]